MGNGHDGTNDAYADSVAVTKSDGHPVAEPNTSPIAVAVTIAEPVAKCVAEPGVDLEKSEDLS